MTESDQHRRDRFVYQLIILALMVSFIAIAPWSSINGDFARDLTIANSIVTGEEFPLRGPSLAGVFHFGPVWFYLLALMQWMGMGYFTIVLTLAVLSSLQFPLAYLAGRAWFNRQIGLIWAILLLIPSWSTYEQVMPGHTSLTATLFILTLLIAHKCLSKPSRSGFALLGLAFSASLHAHPTCILGLPIIVFVFARCGGSISNRLRQFIAFCAGGFALFLPFLLSLINSGESPLDALVEYILSAQSQGSLGQVPELALSLFPQSLGYWFSVLAEWSEFSVSILKLLWILAVLVGLISSAIAMTRRDFSATLFWLSAILGIVVLATMRVFFPFYMLTTLKVVTLAIVAHGLWFALSHLQRRRWAPLIALPALAVYWMAATPIMLKQQVGEWPFAFVPLFMTTEPWHETETLALSNPMTIRQGGRWLCRFPRVALHGAWAQMQVISYGVERSLSCRAGPQVLGGALEAYDHWAGFSVALLDRAGITSSSTIGNFGLIRAKAVIGPGEVILAPDDLAYAPEPALPIPGPQMTRLNWQLDGSGDVLALSNLAFGIAPRPNVVLRCGEREIESLAQDAVSNLLELTTCHQPLQLSVETNAPQYVDIIILDSSTLLK